MHNLRNIREVELTGIDEQLAVEQNQKRVRIFPDSFFEYLGGWQGYVTKVNLIDQDRQSYFMVTNACKPQ